MRYKGNEKEYMRDWHLRTWSKRKEKRVQQKATLRQKRKIEIEEFKKTLRCQRCGCEDHRTLLFHHSDKGSKVFAIANAVQRGYSWKRIMAEVAKCEVICANCHAIEHYV